MRILSRFRLAEYICIEERARETKKRIYVTCDFLYNIIILIIDGMKNLTNWVKKNTNQFKYINT